MWSYGGHEVEPDGKTVVSDSDEPARAVDFARKFFKDTMLDDVLGWTDVSNNKAWYAEQISCTNNAQSILGLAKRDFPDIALGEPKDALGVVGARDLLGVPCLVVADIGPAEDVVEHRVLEEFAGEIDGPSGLVGVGDDSLAVGLDLMPAS